MKYLILGATGTLGRAMINELLKRDDTEVIRALSRDEFKLSLLKREEPDPRIETVIGDIRDYESIEPHFDGIDTVMHFAALKRIPEMESQPRESLKTNVLGTLNVIDAAIVSDVAHVVFSSTDKACAPVNTYGACKFLSEQLVLNANRRSRTNFSAYRWGNVAGSRGAAISQFYDSIKNGIPAHLTDERMGRFWIKIQDAVNFILSTYQSPSDKVRVPEMKAATVVRVLASIARLTKRDATYKVIGSRPGEKMQEDILFDFETGQTLNSGNAPQYTDAELDELIGGLL